MSFTRKVFVRPARAPVKPLERCRGVIRAVSDVVRAIPKIRPVRSEEYRRYVASLPCAECGAEGFSQAAHPNHGKGLGLKTSDDLCFPLCCLRWDFGRIIEGCHSAHDQLRGMTLEQRRERERRYIAATQEQARADGRKEFK